MGFKVFMRKSVFIFLFLFCYLSISSAFKFTAKADNAVAPSNLQWCAPGVIQYEMPTYQTGYCYFETYELQADGSWKRKAQHTTSIMDAHMKYAPRSASGYAILTHDMTHTISAQGINKSLMVRAKFTTVQGDSDFSTGAVSDYSPVYDYHVPQQKLPSPRDIHWSPDKTNTLVWTSDAGVDEVLIRLLIDGQQRKSILANKITVGVNEFDLTDFLNRTYQEFDPAAHHYSYLLQSLTKQIETWAPSDNVPFE